MLKTIVFVFMVILLSQLRVAAQQNTIATKANITRLYIDLEVQGMKHPDTLLFNSINLDSYEPQRKVETRVYITDVTSGYVLILYSQQEADINRAAKWPLQKFNQPQVDHPKSKQ